MNKPKFKSKSAPSAHAEASSKASALMESAQQVWSAGKDGKSQTGTTDSQVAHKDNKDDIKNF